MDVYLSYEDILDEYSQEEIWSWILGFKPTSYFCNSLRADTHPGCWLEWRGRYLRLFDFADRKYHYLSIFDAVCLKFKVDFNTALSLIVKEFKPSIEIQKETKKKANKKVKKKEKIKITIIKKEWSKIDQRFFKPLNISTDDLNSDYVFPIKAYLSNGVYHQVSTPAYALCFESGRCKIYQPTSKFNKWRTNCINQDIGNWENISSGENLIITKSYKDCRILRNLGYDCIWLQNEGSFIPKKYLDIIKSNYTNVYIFFDNDKGGDKASKKLAEKYQFHSFTLPLHLRNYKYKDYFTQIEKIGITDATEFVTNFSHEELEEYVSTNIQTIRNSS